MKVLFLLVCFCLVSVSPVSGETIESKGKSYFDAELYEINRAGAIYKVDGDAEYVTLLWSELSASQLSAVKTKFPKGLDNVRYDACFVKGSVFQVTPDGVIIQIELGFKGGVVYKNGASLISSGLVIIPDLPDSVSREEGAPIEITAHRNKTYTYDMAVAVKEIPYLTVAKPAWAREQEWKNADGQVMRAKLLAVKAGKGMFERAGKRFVYDLADLDTDGRLRALEIGEKLHGIPLP